MIIFPNVLGSSCHYTSLIISPLNSFLSTYSLNGAITHSFYSLTISLLVYGLPLPPYVSGKFQEVRAHLLCTAHEP